MIARTLRLAPALFLCLCVISPATARSLRVPAPDAAKVVPRDLGTVSGKPALGTMPLLSSKAAPKPWLTGTALALTANEKRLVVADADNDKVVIMDAASGKHLHKVAVSGRPERLVVAPDGLAYVASRLARRVTVIDTASGKVTATIDGGVEPFDVALSGDAKTLAVSSSATSEVLLYDRKTLVRPQRVAVTPWPARLVAHPTQARLYVTHMYSGDIDVIDTKRAKRVAGMVLANEMGGPHRLVRQRFGNRTAVKRTPTQAFAATISPDGKRLYVAHLQVNTGEPQRFGGDGYGLGEPAPLLVGITSFDTKTLKRVDTAVPKDQWNANFGTAAVHQAKQREVAQLFSPAALLHHPKRAGLYLAAEGSKRVAVADATAAAPLDGLTEVIETGAMPRGLAMTRKGDRLYVLNGGDFSISVAKLRQDKAAHAKAGAPRELNPAAAPSTTRRSAAKYLNLFGRDPLPTKARRGRTLFASMNVKVGGGRFTCMSCHPSGRHDGLTWNIGTGPRNTPILAGRLTGTGPYNWNGTEKHLQGNVKNTMKRLGGGGLNESDTAALALYIEKHLPGMDNPHVPQPKTVNAERVAQGKTLFHSADVGCANCHDSGNRFTDGALHDIGTAGRDELVRVFQKTQKKVKGVAFNTPGLQGLWATAPYYHDGSAPTLVALLTTGNPHDRMGKTSHLKPTELQALEAYLKTL